MELKPNEALDVKGTLRYMIGNRFPSGNYPSSQGSKSDRFVHWCHGASRMALTVVKAAKAKYLRAATFDFYWKLKSYTNCAQLRSSYIGPFGFVLHYPIRENNIRTQTQTPICSPRYTFILIWITVVESHLTIAVHFAIASLVQSYNLMIGLFSLRLFNNSALQNSLTSKVLTTNYRTHVKAKKTSYKITETCNQRVKTNHA